MPVYDAIIMCIINNVLFLFKEFTFFISVSLLAPIAAGGCCKVCGSVEHLKSNCPERLKDHNKYERKSPGSADHISVLF